MILIELIHHFIYFICIFFSDNIFGIKAEKPSGAIKGIIMIYYIFLFFREHFWQKARDTTTRLLYLLNFGQCIWKIL